MMNLLFCTNNINCLVSLGLRRQNKNIFIIKKIYGTLLVCKTLILKNEKLDIN